MNVNSLVLCGLQTPNSLSTDLKCYILRKGNQDTFVFALKYVYKNESSFQLAYFLISLLSCYVLLD